MDQLEYPSEEEWTRRRQWFEGLFDVDKRLGGYSCSEQALGLLVDLQAVYCTGAFISCILLACTIIDTHIRDVEAPDFDGGMQGAFETSIYAKELEWSRVRRNRLVHFKAEKDPALTVDMQWSDRSDHERDARRAIELVANVMFENPWV